MTRHDGDDGGGCCGKRWIIGIKTDHSGFTLCNMVVCLWIRVCGGGEGSGEAWRGEVAVVVQ